MTGSTVTRRERGVPGGPLGRGLPAIALLLLANLGLACAGGGAGDGDGGDGLLGPYPRAPLVIVSIDTLRSDRLPAYGYEGVETPALDRLAADAVLFERAYSNVPLTLPSHASLLTGALPPEHGVRDNAGFRFDAAAVAYLPLELRRAGYRTGAAVSSFVLRGETGLGAGFERYEDALTREPGRNQRPGAETVDRALDWLEGERGEAFFLFVHLFEPHTPYEPPEPWASRYADPYDGEIAAADAAVGELLDRLESWGLYDRVLLVLVSDHGEGLGDHGEQEHGLLLYREALQVPLLLKLPGKAGAGLRRGEPVQLADVAPTLRVLLGLDSTGRAPLVASGETERGLYAETFFPHFHLGWTGLTSWIDGPLHLIRGPQRPELYDLLADPAERHDLLPERRADYRRLVAALDRRERPPPVPGAEDPETLRRLAALGYLGAAGAGLEIDPAEGLAAFEAMRVAVQDLAAGRFAAAASGLETVVAENPEMTAAWEHLGLALHGAGRLDRAARALERALEASGGSPRIALAAARVATARGRLDEARALAELAVDSDPGEAHGLLAEIALAGGEPATARAEAEAALAARKAAPEPHLVLARVALAEARPAAALGHVGDARAAGERLPEGRPIAGLHTVEGEALARLDRMAEAEAALEREIALHPTAMRAYSLLASVRGFQGRAADARAAVDRMIAADPRPETFALAVSTLRAVRQPEAADELLARARAEFPGHPALH